jgi:AraC family transcriptional regulator of adaptative response/methylated-DNA-[protein]-cysteine methyltransferase
MTTVTEDAAWDAVLRRDRDFDGRVFFAVTSTGIYCRPSCPARRPRRERVRFFGAPGDAEAAGFRACKRCEPVARSISLSERVRAILEQHVEEGITLAELSDLAGASAHHLQRIFKRDLGVSPKDYLAARRTERLKQRLREGHDVTTATYDAGYGSSSRLYSQSNDRLGMTPATYRRGGLGMEIRFTIIDTSLGKLLVGVTERGVCAVALGESQKALAASLREEYPQASIARSEQPALAQAVASIVDQIEGGAPAIELPVDVQATAFQLRVWDALRKIPYGETRTYREIAATIGRPKAVRAVANACANNRVALVIPCHRVIREDGELGGYRWGIGRKEALLALEKKRT